MLNNDRKDYVTASQAHRVMSGFALELQGIDMKKPVIENFDSVEAFFTKAGCTPKVGEMKSLSVDISGSEIKDIIKYLKSQVKTFSEGMESVSREIAMGSFIEARDEGVKTKDMERGHIQELEAVEYLEKLAGVKFEQSGDSQGFLTKGNLGVTPDGIEMLGFDILSCAEVKNPKDTTHMKYLYLIKNQEDLLKYAPEYYWQAQVGLYVTGANFYHWLSYHNQFTKGGDNKGVYVKIEPNFDHIGILKDRSDRVLSKVPQIIEVIKERILKQT